MNTVTPISEASAELARILDAYLAARQAGENPSKQQLLAEHPELADELEDCLASLEFIGTAVSPTVKGEPAEVGMGSAAMRAEPIGDFRLVREIGRGGMGVVYEAVQLSLARRVALKVLPFAAVLDPKQVKRFQNEAQAAASLDHPKIVSVYSVGCERGIHYYAMQYVEGQSLDRIGQEQGAGSGESGDRSQRSGDRVVDTAPIAALSTLGTALPRERFRQIARLGIQAADALHYAHEMGIVHRDIKPSNLLVDSHGHLWITDFGLATTQTDAGLTMTGDLLGTLRYMSPEQAAGDRAKTDYRTDIYSLGITLYELLTREPAFGGTDRKVLFRRIIEDDPKPLRSIDSAIPRDLETIVLKATEKEPNARYDSAAELAADLQRFCEEKPIRARRTSRAERVWRWSKRNRLTAALSITVATLITLVAITAPMIAWRQGQLIDETRQQLYAKDVSIAYNAWNDGDLAHVDGLLDRYAAGSRYEHLRDFPWYYLDGLYQRATAGFMPAEAFDVSLTTNRVAVAKPDGLIHLYDAKSWTEVGIVPWEFQTLDEFHFSPDGRFLAAAYPNGTLSVWDVAARKHLYRIPADSHANRVFSPRFSPDGSILATGGHDREVKIWETTTGKLLRALTGHRDDVSALAFSPDGKTLATGSNDYSLRFWNTDTWTPRAVIENAFSSRVFALTFDPTGARLAAGGFDKEITICDAATGQQLTSLPASSAVWTLCYSPNGQFLAVGSGLQGAVDVWDVEHQKIVQQSLAGHFRVSYLAFLPSGEIVFHSDGKLFRRDVVDQAELAANPATQIRTEDIAIDFSARGDLLVAGYGRYMADPGEGAVACWDLRRGKHWLLPGHDGSSVFDVAIDPSGELIAAGGGPANGPGFVKLWDTHTGTLAAELPKEETFVGGVALSPTGDRLAVVASGRVAVWGSLTSQPELLWRHEAPWAMRVAFSPRGDVLAVGCFPNDRDWTMKNRPAVTIWDAQRGQQLETAVLDRAIMELAFSPDGRYLASIDWGGWFDLYDRHEHRIVLSQLTQTVGMSLAFSPDGRTLATASSSGDVKFWHLPTMMHVTTLKTRGRVGELAFFPDGRTLAVGYLDRTIELWHLDRDKELFSIDEVEDQQ